MIISTQRMAFEPAKMEQKQGPSDRPPNQLDINYKQFMFLMVHIATV